MTSKYFALICTGVFYGYQYIIRVLPSVTMSAIVEKFAVSSIAFGQFSGIYYIGYAAAHLPFGALIDRIGVRFVFLISLLMTFIGLMPIVLSDSWQMMLFGRFISGFGSAGAALTMMKVIDHYFHVSFSKILGITATFGLACAIFAGKPFTLLIDSFGIAHVVNGVIIAGLALTVCGFLLKPIKSNTGTSMSKSIISVLLNYRVYLLCLFGGCMIGTLEGFADMWAVKFFTDARGIQIGNAAFLSSMVFLGMGIGCPIVGYISDKFQRHNIIMFTCGLIMAAGLLILLTDVTNYCVISIIMIIIGIASAYQIPAIAKAATFAKNGTFGLTTSYTNMLLMSFGYVFHSIVGGVLDYTGSISSAIMVIPIMSLIGALGFFFMYIREKKKA